MTAAGQGYRALLAPLLLAALLVAGLVIRILAVEVPGHGGDVFVVGRWAERLAEVGPTGFYPGGGSIYPALLYAYWPLGVLLDGERLDYALKALSIPFDLVIGALLFDMVAGRAGHRAGLGAAALYLLNPAVILAGPVWGQIDAAGALALLATLLATANRRWLLAGALGMLAGLVKPQFGLILLPVVTLAVLEWRGGRHVRPLLLSLGGAAAAYLVIAGPLLLSPLQHLQNIASVTGIRPEASVYAPNPWALLFGYDTPDTGYTLIGGALLLVGLGASLLPLRRGADLRTLLFVGACIVFAFYFLPTRVHERYLFPAMAVLAPLGAVSRPVLAGYLALTAGFAISLLYALVDTTPFALPAEWERVLISQPIVWALSLLLTVAAVTIVLQLWAGAGAPLGSRRTELRAGAGNPGRGAPGDRPPPR